MQQPLMSFEEFSTKACKSYAFEKGSDKILCIGYILMGLFLAGRLLFIPYQGKILTFLQISSGILLVAAGLYGLYLQRNRYRLNEVPSSLSLEEKEIMFKAFIADNCDAKHDPSGIKNYFHSYLKSTWPQRSYIIDLFYDEERFAFSLRSPSTRLFEMNRVEQKRQMATRFFRSADLY